MGSDGSSQPQRKPVLSPCLPQDKYFANPASIEYDDKTGQPKDHTGRPQGRLKELGFESSSIHHAADPVRAVEEAQALFVGGGNGFRLIKELAKYPGLVEARSVPFRPSPAGLAATAQLPASSSARRRPGPLRRAAPSAPAAWAPQAGRRSRPLTAPRRPPNELLPCSLAGLQRNGTPRPMRGVRPPVRAVCFAPRRRRSGGACWRGSWRSWGRQPGRTPRGSRCTCPSACPSPGTLLIVIITFVCIYYQ